jgi:hypothetical protein
MRNIIIHQRNKNIRLSWDYMHTGMSKNKDNTLKYIKYNDNTMFWKKATKKKINK